MPRLLSTDGTKLGELMPGPIAVLSSFVKGFTNNIGSYTIVGHALWSLSHVMVAFVVGSIVDIIIGLFMGWYKIAEAIYKPLYSIIRPIPPIAWIPLVILWAGLGEMTKYIIIFIAIFGNVTLNAYMGARAVDHHMVGATKMFGANDLRIFTSVVLPSSVPYIFAGLQVAMSACWATVLAAEMVRSTEGVGWMIVSGMENNNTTQILVGIIVQHTRIDTRIDNLAMFSVVGYSE